MNGNHALDVLTGNKEFPFGEIIDGTLIICLSSDHRKNVAEGFRKVGRYILPGAQCRGHKYTTIIIFTPPSSPTFQPRDGKVPELDR